MVTGDTDDFGKQVDGGECVESSADAVAPTV